MNLLQKAQAVWGNLFRSSAAMAMPTGQRVVSQMNTATGSKAQTVPALTGSVGERQGLPAERISNRQRVRELR